MHTSTCVSGDPRDPPSAPRTAQTPLPFKSRTHHVLRRALRKKMRESYRRCKPGLLAQTPHGLPSPSPASPLAPGLQGGPCPHSADPPCGLCRNWPTQRCLTPGKPKSAVNLTLVTPSAQAVNAGEGRRDPPPWNSRFLMTARGWLPKTREAPRAAGPPATAESLAIEALRLFFLLSLFCY